jgi:glutathione S-transferase
MIATAVVATGIAEKSIADDFEDRFNAFYLAEVTQLGQLARNSKGTTCCQPAAQKRDDMVCCA